MSEMQKIFLRGLSQRTPQKSLIRSIVNTYFDTRGSYRKTSNSVSHMQIYRIINKLGEGCKDSVQIADELQPRWSGFLGCDGKVIKIHGEAWVLLTAVDLGTQDIVDSSLAKGEDYISLDLFLRRVRDCVGYDPKEGVVDVDRAWMEASTNVFPDVSLQVCVVHFERIVDREMPKRKRHRNRRSSRTWLGRSSMQMMSLAQGRLSRRYRN